MFGFDFIFGRGAVCVTSRDASFLQKESGVSAVRCSGWPVRAGALGHSLACPEEEVTGTIALTVDQVPVGMLWVVFVRKKKPRSPLFLFLFFALFCLFDFCCPTDFQTV